MSIRNHLGTALITGASTGIGATYADRLARRGYDLILVARNREKLDALARRITNETQRSVEVLTADLNDHADLERVESKLRTDASITMLVNNAGTAALTPLASSDVTQLQSMIELNVTALMRLTAAVTPGFIARHSGAIINISSIVSVAPELLNGVYGGTKAFVLAFSQSLHHELSSQGIRVQVVLPGATATDLWSIAGTPVEHLPQEIVMTVDDLVDASLAGFDAGEFATVPALPDLADWNTFEAARLALKPNLSRTKPAARYGL
jgi:short-subunit dehydrogenase